MTFLAVSAAKILAFAIVIIRAVIDLISTIKDKK